MGRVGDKRERAQGAEGSRLRHGYGEPRRAEGSSESFREREGEASVRNARLLFLVVPEKTAIDEDGCARDVVGFVGSQKGDDFGYVVWVTEAFERDVRE